MQKYKKRLITVTAAYALVIALVAALFGGRFATDAGQISGAPLPELQGMEGFGRARDKSEPLDLSVYSASGERAALPEGFQPVLQNGGLTLYYSEETSAVALQNGETGQIWFSNPVDAQQETLVGGEMRDALLSQITVGYYSSGGQMIYLDSYNAGVKNGTVEYSVESDRLLVSYHISRAKLTITDIPQQLTDERFRELTSRMSEADAKEMEKYYFVHNLDGITSEKTRRLLIEQYKNIENGDVWAVDVVTDRIITKVHALLDGIGYTTEELIRDNEENGIEDEVEEKAYFDVTLVYSLEEGRLRVLLDAGEMQYAAGLPPAELRILEFFGAAGTEAQGYLLVPDGSGGLIHYNNGRTTAPAYDAPVYGLDSSMTDTGRYQVTEQVLLPVYGAKTGGSAYVCLLREGASLGRICAAVSGQTYSYNRAYPVFNTAQSQQMSLTAGTDADIIVQEKQPYQGKIVLEYLFLEGEQADYSGMAQAVRGRLLETGELVKKDFPAALPLDVSYLGAVPKKETVFGISTTVQKSMTTFAQAAELTEMLIFQNAAPTGVTLIGWFNGGTAQKAVLSVKPERVLGGQKQLLALQSQLEGYGIPLFGQTYFASVFRTGNGYSKRAHSPRRLNGDISVGYTYDLMNRYKTGAPIYQVSPKHLPEFVDIFADKAARLSSLGISSADLGSVLGADFSASEPVGRPQAEALHTAALEALCGQFPVKLNAPNLYAWRFADSIACLPTDDSWYSIVNESVPLTPMVLSGLIPYTASPLNLAPDYRTALLEAVEYGAGLNYLLMDREPGLLKETAYNYYTTGKASDWIPIAAQDYQKANALLKNTVGQQIVRHVRLDSELYRTDYANGICVYVNYADAAVRYQNLEIGAKDYRVVEP